jgi:hypothetical protein
LAALALVSIGCRRAAVRSNEVVSTHAAKLSTNPADSVWQQAPEYLAKLHPQDLVEPRPQTATTSEVLVRSVNSGSEIAFRLEWRDPVVNDLPGPATFLDGCAVQIPKKIERDAPEPQMGQAGRLVDISFWRADWQASVNGRKDTIQSIYPNASIDHYPFEAKSLEPGSAAQKEMMSRYAPAQAVGNRRVGPREFPVEDMIAEGPGTLSPNREGTSRGQGIRTKDGWAVVIQRKMPEGFTPAQRTQIAFAVWEGSAREVGARKMITGWVPLAMKEAPR